MSQDVPESETLEDLQVSDLPLEDFLAAVGNAYNSDYWVADFSVVPSK